MRTKLIVLLTALACQPALASGGLNCTAEGNGVTFDVSGGVTRGMGGPLFSFEGTVEVVDKSVAADLGKTDFAREHVAQYWLDGDDLRLLLYRERDADKPHGYVQLTIETKARPGDDGEGYYDGTYSLTVFDGVGDNSEGETVERSGEIVCSAE